MAVTSNTGGLPLSVHLFRVTVISAMATCVAAAVALFVQFVLPTWDGSYLALLTALLTFETLLFESTVREAGVPQPGRLRIRIAEFGLILFLLKPASYLGRGLDAFLYDALGWLGDPLSFLDTEYALGAIFLLVVWAASVDIAHGLYKLSDYDDPNAQSEGMADIQTDFIAGAYLLLLLLGLRHVAATLLRVPVDPVQSSMQLVLPLVYVALGLLVLGQARLSLLRARWEREGVPVDPRVGKRWTQWGLLLVGGVCLLALVLPAGNTITGFYILMWIEYILSFVAVTLLTLFAVLLGLILAPCLTLSQANQPATTPAPFRLPPPPPMDASPDWLSQLRLLVFWVLVAALLFVLIRMYWQDRGGMLRGKRIGGLKRLWLSLLGWLRRARKQVAAFRLGRPSSPGPVPAPSLPAQWWAQWRARTARERVQRLYLALLERAARSGYPRAPSQTPFEYASHLEPRVPSESESLDALTEAFVAARYSERNFSSEELSGLHRLWKRLQAALRAVRGKRESA